MDARAAIEDTLNLAKRHRQYSPADGPLSFDHLYDMTCRVSRSEMSDTKLCRWLGWMQAAIVSWGVATLDDMKEINRRYAD